MASVVQFTVDDTSPTVFYAPIGDTFGSPNLSAGWNPHWDSPGFSSANLGAVGSGTSLHITSLNGASLQIQWTGIGIELFGNVTSSSYAITVDNHTVDASPSANLTAGILFSVDNLDNRDHTLSLTVQTNGPESLFEFDSATVSAFPSPSNISTLTFTEQVLNDTFAFIGKWSFLNDSDSSHQSTTAGDSASIQFTGTALQLLGSTSPQAGNYTVTLDNVTTSFSARSSFSQANSLLFFASGLDAETTHHLNITNTDGATLVLPVGGASVWTLADTSPSGASSSSASASSSPSATAQTGSGLPSGTIAALVLAGVLIFFVAICALLYFFLYRPYRRRQLLRRQQAKESQDQDVESVLVVDIAPEEPTKKSFYNDISVAGPSRDRSSKRGGFARWKEEVEGGLGSWGRGALGIAFRHSDSTGRREASRSDVEYDLGATSDGYKSTSSSSNGDYPGQGKGKARERSGRWPRRSRDKSLSPKFKLDLPMEPRSRSGSRSAQSNAPSSNHQDPSVISSLSYLSSPSLHPTTLPPSPRRPSPHPNTHSRVGSEGPLLAHTDAHLPEGEQDSQPPLPPLPPVPSPQSRPTDSRNDDRGSVREYDADDGRSILGDGTARIALRSLSPRTVEADHRTRTKRRVKKDKQMTSSPLANPSPDYVDTSTSRAEGPDNLSLRASSPFQVDFDQTDRRATQSTQSRVRFHDAPDNDVQASENQGGGLPAPDESRRQPSQAAPLRPTQSSDHLRNMSFLDFASSSEGSMISRSNDHLSSSRSFGSLSAAAHSHWSTGGSSNVVSLVPPPQPQSRWSATTTPGSDLQPERQDSTSSSDSNFPFPVSLPPSPHHPEGTFMPPPQTFMTQLSGAPPRGSALSSLNAHPSDLLTSIPTSPTNSDVPMSLSDIHFQQSDSEEQGGSHLPAHPPLPSTPSQPPQDASYIVQRVVGMHASTPSLGNTLNTPTLTATRFNTSSNVETSPGSSSSKGRDS
ncbi:hypothetical protein B0H12DRAFT_1320500 [Mycena haematopus]|nr:hypothetical protein B0H12DRAFT_1320500 [Mycena haematopus]